MMRGFPREVLFLLLTPVLASPARAQRTTGAITGTVRDESGSALPSVTVVVRGPNIVGSATTLSNERGLFHLQGLPPGSYTLIFSLPGFKTLNRTGVRVSVGGTFEESPTLAVSALTEEVDVVASAPVVDTSSNQVSTNYERTWIEGAPLHRDSFFDLAGAAPGSLTAGDASAAQIQHMTNAYGSSVDENSYQLDGAGINDSFVGDAFVQPNPDAIEEIQILSLGAPAEYGQLTGAVYNIVTRQGTNDFHGDANLFLQTQGLTSDSTRGLTRLPGGAFADACPNDDTKRCPFRREAFSDITLQLGGPIWKDKLWFFASYEHKVDDYTSAGFEPIPDVDEARRNQRYLFKLNYQLGPRHKLQASFHLDHERFLLPSPPNFDSSTAHAYEASRPTPGISYTGVLTDKTVVEVRYSGFYGNSSVGPADADQPRGLPFVYNLDSGKALGGWIYWYDNNRRQSTVAAKVSHLADDFLGGSHDFRFGVQYHDSEAAGVVSYSEQLIVHYDNGQSYGYGFRSSPRSYSGDTRGTAAYVDDTFRLGPRLSLNLGLRFDHEKAFSGEHPRLDESAKPTGASYSREDHFSWSTLSPRLGFNWKLSGNGKTVLRGHWGRYYRGIATAEWQGVVEQDEQGGASFGEIEPGTLTLTNLVALPSNRSRSVDPNYQAPHMDQFIVNVERELRPGLGLQVSCVYKRGGRYAAWQDIGGVYDDVVYADDQGADASGAAIPLKRLLNPLTDLSYVLTNRDEMHQDTHAASIVLLKRFSGRFFLNASLTFQRSRGRTAQSPDVSALFQRGGAQFSFFGSDPNQFVNTGGRLGADVPVQAKVQGQYRLPHDVFASLSFSYHEGATLLRRVPVGDLTNQPGARILGEERGRLGRLPAVTLLDIRLGKDFRIGKGARLGLSVDVLNLLNENANQYVVSDDGTAPNYHQPQAFYQPRRAILGAKVTF